MNSFGEESMSDSPLDEISNLFGSVTGRSTTSSNYVTVPMFEGLRRELGEQVQTGLSLQLEQLRKVEEKCNVILVKVPVLESRTEEQANLKRQLEKEREERRENERKFMECVDKLMEEIVQLTLRVMTAEEGVEEMKKLMVAEASKLKSKSKAGPDQDQEMVEILNSLRKDIQSKLKEFGDSQASLEEKIDRIKREVGSNGSEIMSSVPVEVIMNESPSPAPRYDNPRGGRSSTGSHYEQQTQHGRDLSKPDQFACFCGETFKRLSSFDKHLGGMRDRPPDSPQNAPTRLSTRLRKKRSKQPPITSQRSLKKRGEEEPPKGCVAGVWEDNFSDIDVLHGKAPTAGRFLPHLCLCGMEFQSAPDLLKHAGQQDTGQPTIDRALDLDDLMRGNDTDVGGPLPEVLSVVKPTTSPRRNLKRNRVNYSRLRDKPHGIHPSQPLSCLCGKTYVSKINLKSHINYCLSNKRENICKSCGRQFPFRSRLLAHMTTDHPTALHINILDPDPLVQKSKYVFEDSDGISRPSSSSSVNIDEYAQDKLSLFP